jgi:hypothetical protein
MTARLIHLCSVAGWKWTAGRFSLIDDRSFFSLSNTSPSPTSYSCHPLPLTFVALLIHEGGTPAALVCLIEITPCAIIRQPVSRFHRWEITGG